MMRRKHWFLGLVLALLLAAIPASALGAKPEPFTAGGFVAVIGMSDPVPAGASGRVLIGWESLLGGIGTGPPALVGKTLTLEQKSNELFSSADLTTAVALDGSSVGTFAVVDPGSGEVVTAGRYHLNVSNIPGCQIYDEGHWSTTGGELKGRGTITACLNYGFDPDGPGPLPPTFAGQVTFSGTLH